MDDVRSTSTTIHFSHPFTIRTIEGTHPAGDYTVVTEDAPIAGLTLIAYRRLATFVEVPSMISRSIRELVPVAQADLDDALLRDRHERP